MVAVMNNTKWDEVRLAMYDLGNMSPSFRYKDLKDDEPWPWDGEWYYHFCGRGRRPGRGYETIEWCELRTTTEEQREAVRGLLRQIHVPGIETADGFCLFGWIEEGAQLDYIG